jgi:Cu(I)/Ag(I) efflux system membrane fusion protein
MTRGSHSENSNLILTAKIASAALVLFGTVFGGYLYFSRVTTVPMPGSHHIEKLQYCCPMHPFIITERPGSCPICSMDLTKKIHGAEMSHQIQAKVPHVEVSPSQQVIANITTAPATVIPFNMEIPVTGVVAYNQERQGKVTSWLAGRLDRLVVKSIGSPVTKGKPVAEIYSYDLVTAQEEYLLAYKALRLFDSTITPIFTQNSMGSLFDARQRLRQLQFSDQQIEELQKRGKPVVRQIISSSISGVITEKFVTEGQYVNVGDPLFSVADLSLIWVELEVFEPDLPYLKVGQELMILSPALPGQPLQGRVKLIYPFLDQKTRTVKVRVELPNPGLKLKPEMYVRGQIKVPLGSSLTVASESVMDTGKRQVVWIEAAPGTFLQRDVTTGARSGGHVQILSGLKAGEKVALRGGYLIDSESQLSHGQQKAPASDLDMSGMDMSDTLHSSPRPTP